MRQNTSDVNGREPDARENAVSDFLVQYLLSGELKSGDMMPNPRSVAVELGVHPDVVVSVLSKLNHAGVIEPGVDSAYVILPHGLTKLQQSERQRFLDDEWPVVLKKIQTFGLNPDELFADSGEEAK